MKFQRNSNAAVTLPGNKNLDRGKICRWVVRTWFLKPATSVFSDESEGLVYLKSAVWCTFDHEFEHVVPETSYLRLHDGLQDVVSETIHRLDALYDNSFLAVLDPFGAGAIATLLRCGLLIQKRKSSRPTHEGFEMPRPTVAVFANSTRFTNLIPSTRSIVAVRQPPLSARYLTRPAVAAKGQRCELTGTHTPDSQTSRRQ